MNLLNRSFLFAKIMPSPGRLLTHLNFGVEGCRSSQDFIWTNLKPDIFVFAFEDVTSEPGAWQNLYL